MKKSLLALAIGIMLITIPLTTVAKEKTLVDNRVNLEIINKIDERFIAEYGEKKLIELKNNIMVAVTSSVFNHVEYSYDSDGLGSYIAHPDKDVLGYMDTIDYLILLCTMIGELCLVLFGHNEMAYYLALITCYIFMLIPARLLSIPAIIEEYQIGGFSDSIRDILSQFNLWGIFDQLEEVFYEYGLIGGFLVMLIASPILIFVVPIVLIAICCLPALALPLIRTIYTVDILNYIVLNAFGIW